MHTLLRKFQLGRWLWCGTVLLVGGACLTVLDRVGSLNDNLDIIGNILLVIGTWLTLYGLSKQPVSTTNRMSFGEKQSILGFVVTALIGAYLLFSLRSIGWVFDVNDQGMRTIGQTVVLILICSWVFSAILRSHAGSETLEDERDRALRQRAANTSYAALGILLMVLIVTLGLTPPDRLLFSSPIGIAHSLIGVLLLSELVRYSGEIWRYRRERL